MLRVGQFLNADLSRRAGSTQKERNRSWRPSPDSPLEKVVRDIILRLTKTAKIRSAISTTYDPYGMNPFDAERF